MMFAHAAFEHRVSDLMNVITSIVRFGRTTGPTAVVGGQTTQAHEEAHQGLSSKWFAGNG
jgi:hypothetical protein